MPELPPQPRILLESLRHMGYTLKSAISDIIDNSVSAGATRISIQYRGQSLICSTSCIAICDDGIGMSRDTLLQSMKFGSRSSLEDDNRSELDLGRFGLGMKMASISQCRKLTVFSWQKKEVNAFCWDLDKIEDKWDVIELSQNEIQQHHVLNQIICDLQFSVIDHGTVVLWENLDRENTKSNLFITETMDNVRKHIALVFHRFMRPEVGYTKIILFDMNNMKIEPKSPFGPESEKRYILNSEVFSCMGYKVTYQPYILPRSVDTTSAEYEKYAGEEGYLQNQGFYVYRNRRLIEKATWFNKHRKEIKTQLLRIQVDIPAELDAYWSIDVKKSQTMPPEDIQKRVLSIVDQAMTAAKRHWDSHLVNTVKLPNDMQPLWEVRQVSSTRSSYRINMSHPLLKIIKKALPKEYRDVFASYLDSVACNFPYERYCAEKKKIENEDKSDTIEEEIRKKRIMKLMEVAGLASADIHKIITSSEI